MCRLPRISCACALALVGVLALAPASSRADSDPTPESPISAFERVAGAVLVLATDLDFVQRYKQLAGTVAQTHDLDGMLADRLGALAKELDAEQTKALKNLLFKRLVATYAMAFDGRGGRTLRRVGGGGSADGRRHGVEFLLEGDGEPRTLVMDSAADGGEERIRRVRWGADDDGAAERAADAAAYREGGFDRLVAAWNARVPLPERPAPVAAQTPRQVVETLQDALIDAMKQAATLGFQGRYDRLLPVVDATHDLPRIARLSLRRHWNTLTPAQQERFEERFRVLSVARYAGRFDGYKGEAFEVVGEEQGQGTDVVRSNLVKSNGEKIPFVFQLRAAANENPRILNITADGVSDLATKQAEYARIMDSGGFEALMAKVEEQIRKQQ